MNELLRDAIEGPRVQNSHAQVVNGIGRAIILGDFPEGEPLPRDDDLAARFGVSRSVLREAMKTLAAKGMLVARTRIGTRVTPRRHWNYFDADVLGWILDSGVGREFLDHLFEMRLAIEPFGAGLAARNAGPEAVATMWRQVDGMRVAADDRAFVFADLAFHRAIIEASGNPFLFSVGALIEAALLTTFRLSSPAESPGTQTAVAEAHGRIVDRIEARDQDGAAEAMRNVILVGKNRISRAAE